MADNTSEPARLTEMEHTIMEFIWSEGPSSAERIREGLADTWPMKDSTVRTVLRRLEKKGFLKHRVEGRTYIYSGVESPEHIAVRAVRRIVDKFCQGSVEALLVGMVENRVIKKDQLKKLADEITRTQGETP